jgi:hypothetical protein
VIRENLKLAQMRQKSYHDKGTAPRHYVVGDYLKVSSRFHRPKVAKIWRQRETSPTIYRAIRDHRGMWTSCLSYPTSGSICGCAQCVSCDTIEERCESTRDRSDHGSERLDRARSFSGRASLRVLDQKERQTRRHTVKMYKIQWSHHSKGEATWETEHFLNTKYPGFLQSRNGKNLTPTFVFNFRISGRDSF